MFGFFIKNQVSADVWVYVWIFSLVSLLDMSALGPIPFCFYYYSSTELEIEDSDTSSISFIIQNCFSFPEFLCFHMKIKIVLSIPVY